jgi:threonine synthase
MAEARSLFSAYRLDDAGTLSEIASTSHDDGMVLDPHSAVGVSAARRAIADGTLPDGTPVVALACAHPAKFQDAVQKATGTVPALPANLADLMQRPERKHMIEASDAAVKALVLEKKRSL